MKPKVSKLFEPSSFSKVWLLQQRRQGSPYGFGGMSFKNRINWRPAGMTKHQIGFARRFSHLHHLACHAPVPIAIKWKPAYNMFMNRHFGDRGKHSTRFANSHTCHKFL
jgi:hypothetical protein